MTISTWHSDAPKIVQIETRYVETDAINFRAVVQSLTGKNSSTAWIGNAGSSSAPGSHDGVCVKPQEVATTDAKKNSLISSTVLKNLSFKDFDRLLSDLPPMDELLW